MILSGVGLFPAARLVEEKDGETRRGGGMAELEGKENGEARRAGGDGGARRKREARSSAGGGGMAELDG